MNERVGVSPRDVWRCYEFARDMQGHHNNTLIMQRSSQQIFRDDLRGKLAEIAVKKYLERQNHNVGELDFEIYDLGTWDRDDIVVDNSVHVSVKSSGENANYLLIETNRVDPETGEYSYRNNNGDRIIVNHYAFVNVSIAGEHEDDFTTHTDMCDFLQIEDDTWTAGARRVMCYLRGFLSDDQFWRIKRLAPRGIKATKDNFGRVSRDENVVADPAFVESDRRWLQKVNYLVCLDQFGEYLPQLTT